MYYYCDTCGESYTNQLDEFDARDFLSIYKHRLHQSVKGNEASSHGVRQTTSEEAATSQPEHGNEEDVSAEDTDHEHGLSFGTQGHDMSFGTQGSDVLQDSSQETSLSQTQEHDTSGKDNTQQEGDTFEEHRELQNIPQEQATSEHSTYQVSSVPSHRVNIVPTSQHNLSSAPFVDAALLQDFLPLEVTSTNCRQDAPPPFPLEANLNSHSSQVTNPTTLNTSCNGHLDTGNDNEYNETAYSGGPPGENSITGESPGESTVTANSTSQFGGERKCLPARRVKRKKPYDLDNLQEDHRVC